MRCLALQELGSSVTPLLPSQGRSNSVESLNPVLAPYSRTLSEVAPVTFGHRPRSASRMVFNAHGGAEVHKTQRAKKGVRRQAGMSAAVLQELLRSEERSLETQASSSSSNTGSDLLA
jgi:hypothetical protein